MADCAARDSGDAARVENQHGTGRIMTSPTTVPTVVGRATTDAGVIESVGTLHFVITTVLMEWAWPFEQI